jgi:hypothetical protein
MIIMIISILASNFEKIKLNVDISNTIFDIKKRLKKIMGIPIQQQYLIYSRKILVDEMKLEDYGLYENVVINLVVI